MIIKLSTHKAITDAEYFNAFLNNNDVLIRKFMNDNRSVFYRAINKIYGNKSDEFLDEVFVVSLTKLWEKITNRAIILEQLTVPLKDYLIGFGKLIAHEVEKQYNPIKKNSQKTCNFFCPSCGNEEEITLSKFTKDGSRIPCCVCGTKMIVDVEKEVRSAGCEYGSSMDVEKMPSDTPQDITQQIRDALFDGQRLNDLMWEAIDRALKQMRVQCQQLLDMVYWRKMSYEDIIQQIPNYTTANSAKNQKGRCLTEIKSEAIRLYNQLRNQ